MLGRCISYWNSPFLGDMLVFQAGKFLVPLSIGDNWQPTIPPPAVGSLKALEVARPSGCPRWPPCFRRPRVKPGTRAKCSKQPAGRMVFLSDGAARHFFNEGYPWSWVDSLLEKKWHPWFFFWGSSAKFCGDLFGVVGKTEFKFAVFVVFLVICWRLGKLTHKLLYQILDIDETKVIILPCQTMPIKGKSLKFTNTFALCIAWFS